MHDGTGTMTTVAVARHVQRAVGTRRATTAPHGMTWHPSARHGPCAAVLLCLVLAGCAGTPAHPNRTSTTAWPGSSPYTPAQPYASAAPLRQALGRYYQTWAGVPYEYGGTTKSGIDCSAFVRQTVAHVSDVSLPRTTGAQVMRGYAIPRSALRTGDLVFFKTGGSRHVGVYLGNGRFMHASSSVGVTISRLNNVYWRRHFWQARRLPIH